MSLVLENVIIRIEIIVFRDYTTGSIGTKFCHSLTKPIITRISVSLVFKNVLIRTGVLFSENL